MCEFIFSLAVGRTDFGKISNFQGKLLEFVDTFLLVTLINSVPTLSPLTAPFSAFQKVNIAVT